MTISVKLVTSKNGVIVGKFSMRVVLDYHIKYAEKNDFDPAKFLLSESDAIWFINEYNDNNNTLRNDTEIVFVDKYVDITAMLNIKMTDSNIVKLVRNLKLGKVAIKYKGIPISIYE